MKFTEEFIKELHRNGENVVYEELIEELDHSCMYDLVFIHEGKYYMSNYQKNEDQGYHAYEEDCYEVVQVEEVIKKWEKRISSGTS